MRLTAALILCGLALLGGLVFPVMAQPTAPEHDTLGLVNYHPMFDRPIDPNLYLIRPGDKLRITFLHTNLSPLEITVSPEAAIIHPNLGLVDASGLTLAQLRDKLKGPLAQQYNTKDIAITVTEPRQIAITIAGAVVKPGRYRMYNSEQVSDAIDMAGGVRPGGSNRCIRLVGGARELQADLDRTVFLGDNTADPYLYAGTRIEVPAKTGEVVEVTGEVLEPREVELRPGDNLQTLIVLAGGLTRNADVTKAHILGDKARDPHTDGNIKAGDILNIPALDEGRLADIGIFGEVNFPGRYLLLDGLSVDSLLTMAGGATDKANLGRITIFRVAESDFGQGDMRERYAIDASFDAKSRAMALQPFDSVVVPRRLGWVRVSGMVKTPGLVPYVEGKDAIYYITAAGGAVGNANIKEAMVFNRVSRITSVAPVSVAVHDGDEVTLQAVEQRP